MFGHLVDEAFLANAAKLAAMPMKRMMKEATGRDDWKPEDYMAFSMDHGDPERELVVRVKTAQLSAALTKFGKAVPVDDHNYRRRYENRPGMGGGDREYWEAIVRNNPSQRLPMLHVSFTDYNGRKLINLRDLAGDATYVNAMIRDNAWETTYIATSHDSKWVLRPDWGVELPDCRLDMNFMSEFQEQVEEALNVLRPGTVLGNAVKTTSQAMMGRAKPLERERTRQREIPRGDLWSLEGTEVTTHDLLWRNLLPAAQVAVAVHHRLVSAFVWGNQPPAGVVPLEVAQGYRDSRGEFAWY